MKLFYCLYNYAFSEHHCLRNNKTKIIRSLFKIYKRYSYRNNSLFNKTKDKHEILSLKDKAYDTDNLRMINETIVPLYNMGVKYLFKEMKLGYNNLIKIRYVRRMMNNARP